MKRNIIIGIITLLIGTSCLTFGILYSLDNSKEEPPKDNLNELDNILEEDIEDEELEEGILIKKFKVYKKENQKALSLTLQNNTSNDYEDILVKLNFYDKDNTILQTYELPSQEFISHMEIEMESFLEFENSNLISKYEIEYNNKKIEIVPNKNIVYKID